MPDIVVELIKECIQKVFESSLNSEPGTFLSMNRAVEISHAHLMRAGGVLVENALPRLAGIRKDQSPDAVLESCVEAIVDEIRPALEKVVAWRFLDLNATNLVELVDEIVDAIAAVLRNEYIGLSPIAFRPMLNDMKRVNIWSERVFEGGGRNEVRLLGVSMQNLHQHLTYHQRAGLIWRIKRYTDLLHGVSLFCVLVGSEEFSLAEAGLGKRKLNRRKPKYMRLENYADIKRWFDDARRYSSTGAY